MCLYIASLFRAGSRASRQSSRPQTKEERSTSPRRRYCPPAPPWRCSGHTPRSWERCYGYNCKANLIMLTSKSLALSKVPLMMLFRCLSKLCAVITILSFFGPFVIFSNFLSGIHLVFRIMRIAAYSSRAPVMRYRTEGMEILKLLTEHQEDADDQVQVDRIQTRGCGGILSGGNTRVFNN